MLAYEQRQHDKAERLKWRDIAIEKGISDTTYYKRLQQGMSYKEAATKPKTRKMQGLKAEIAKHGTGISTQTYYDRRKAGMTHEQAITKPKQIQGRKHSIYDEGKEFVVYKGDNLLVVGSAAQCIEYMGIAVNTFRYYLSAAYKQRAEESEQRCIKRGIKYAGRINIIEVEIDDDDPDLTEY